MRRPGGRFCPILAVSLTAMLSSSGPSRGQDDPAPKGPMPHATGTFQGANACYQCHRQPTITNRDEGQMKWCLFTEFSTWRTVDKHSMAYAVLEGPRGQEIGEKLGVVVTEPEGGCLSCHAQNFPEQQVGPGFDNKDGVNCEVCHGPSGGGAAGGWMNPHQFSDWRLNTPEEKAALGMWDLRDPAVQSELCLSCHIGSAELGRVVSHPMYAAGHPPLPSIDVARFVKNIPQHWRDKDHVPWWEEAPEEIREANGIADNKLYETELTMVGNIIALRESMEMLADRASVDTASPGTAHKWPELSLNKGLRVDPRFGNPDAFPELALSRWPEMAMTHSDCLACHHDLRYPGWRQRRGFDGPPGRPMPRSFPLALIDLNLDQFGDESDRNEFEAGLRRLIEAFADRPFGRPAEVRDAASDLARWADEFHERRLESASFAEETGPVLMQRLCELNRGGLPDYDTARQIASALQVIYREWHDRNPEEGTVHERIEAILDSWDTALNLGRYPKSEERDELSLSILRQLTNDPQLSGFAAWVPAVLGFPKDPEVFWKASQNNPILLAFFQKVSPARMREAYVSDDFKVPLQEINNEGLRIALDLASQYDPYRFQAELQELSSLLPAPSTD